MSHGQRSPAPHGLSDLRAAGDRRRPSGRLRPARRPRRPDLAGGVPQLLLPVRRGPSAGPPARRGPRPARVRAVRLHHLRQPAPGRHHPARDRGRRGRPAPARDRAGPGAVGPAGRLHGDRRDGPRGRDPRDARGDRARGRARRGRRPLHATRGGDRRHRLRGADRRRRADGDLRGARGPARSRPRRSRGPRSPSARPSGPSATGSAGSGRTWSPTAAPSSTATWRRRGPSLVSRSPRPARDGIGSVLGAPQPGRDRRQLRSRDAHPLEGVAGKLHAGLHLRVGHPAHADLPQRCPVAGAAGPARDGQARDDRQRPLGGEPGDERIRHGHHEEPSLGEAHPIQDRRARRVAVDDLGAQPRRLVQPAPIAIDHDAAEAPRAHGARDEEADPSRAQHDDVGPAVRGERGSPSVAPAPPADRVLDDRRCRRRRPPRPSQPAWLRAGTRDDRPRGPRTA